MDDPQLYDRVALARDIPQHGLKRGDVATLIDVVPHPSGARDGLVLEVTNALGESIQVVIVERNEVESLHADEVLAVRPLVKTA